MIVYRLCKVKYAMDLSGKGAENCGGRWNSKGTAMLYTSGSRALAVTEIAVHTPLGNLPTDYHLITLEVPEISIFEIEIQKLSAGWTTFPYSRSTQLLGDQFITVNKFLILKAPSAVVPGDYNYLLNPIHEDFHQVRILHIEAFEFDTRLFQR